jgi:hypothetical protein
MATQNPMEYPHWDGLTVEDFIEWLGVGGDLHQVLRAIDKYNAESASVWINGKWIGPDDSIDGIGEHDAIEKLRVSGIAWDGSDWEWAREISGDDDPNIVMGRLSDLREQFRDALADYRAERDAGLLE